jgi:hypothetical protein
MDLRLIMQDPRNKGFYNLYDFLTPPTGTRKLLGLGLKFCMECKLQEHHIQDTVKRLETDVRQRCDIEHFGELFEHDPGEFNQRLYIKSGLHGQGSGRF